MKDILLVGGLVILAYLWIRVALQRLRRTFERIKARLDMMEHHRIPGTGEKTLQLLEDPNADVVFTAEERAAIDAGKRTESVEFVTGHWNRCHVRVELLVDELKLKVPLKHWPQGLKLSRARAFQPAEGATVVTGDRAFDAAINVRAANDSWRLVLTSEVRESFMLLFNVGGAKTVFDNGTIIMTVGYVRIGGVDRMLDLATRIARAVPPPPTDGHAAVFEVARAERDRSVRLGHYRWLIDVAWNPAAVYRAAESDPDPEIAAWGRAELPPAGGAFR